MASWVAQMVKNLPAMQETQVRSMGWEVLLERGMATHLSIFGWTIPRTQEPGGLQSMGLQSDTTEKLTLSHTFHTIWSSNPTSTYKCKGNKTITWKRYLYSHAHCNILHYRRQPKCLGLATLIWCMHLWNTYDIARCDEPNQQILTWKELQSTVWSLDLFFL